MKKFSAILIFIFLPFFLFAESVSFEDFKATYEDLITSSNLETLRNFSNTLDMFLLSSDYKTFSKYSDYKEAFSVLNKETKKLLKTFENPWDPSLNSEPVRTKLIDEKCYYFVIIHNGYVTKRILFYRIVFTASTTIIIFTFILLLLQFNARKEKQKNLVSSKALISGGETERKRVSEEIHDTVVQNLKAEKFMLLAAIEKLKNNENIEEDLYEILSNSKANITEIRAICQKLFPPDFENQNLEWIIAEFCQSIKKDYGIECTHFVDNESPWIRLNVEDKLNLFRIIQEAVNNAALHSGCSKIEIFLTKTELIISDNGCGFNTEEKLKKQSNHFGLRSLKERAQILNKTLEIKSDSSGTKVSIKNRR